jgi:hypothetical protein
MWSGGKEMKNLLAFIIGLAVFMFIWWLSGFNFDRRGPDVAGSAIGALSSGAFGICLIGEVI